jgi:hypothetical protein
VQEKQHWSFTIMPADKNPLFNATQFYLEERVDACRCLYGIVIFCFPLQIFVG